MNIWTIHHQAVASIRSRENFKLDPAQRHFDIQETPLDKFGPKKKTKFIGLFRLEH
jgi:hypothetical protein